VVWIGGLPSHLRLRLKRDEERNSTYLKIDSESKFSRMASLLDRHIRYGNELVLELEFW
jgi:hypothetical protein